MTIEVTRTQFAALVRGETAVVGPSKRVIKLKDGPFTVKHYGPGPHPGTGTSQDVHGKGRAKASIEEAEPTFDVGDFATWSYENDELVRITKVNKAAGKVDIEIVSGQDAGGFYNILDVSEFSEPEAAEIEFWTDDSIGSIVERAKIVFGETNNIAEAGYILKDGTMLDFSGKNQGGASGIRAFDHRQITTAFSIDSDLPTSTDGMVWFMDKARAIRVSSGRDLHVDFAGPPSQVQKDIVLRYGMESDEVVWDVTRWFDDEKGGQFRTLDSGFVAGEYEEIKQLLDSIRGIYYKPDYEEKSVIRLTQRYIKRLEMKHYAEVHPGTGTDQSVHGDGGAGTKTGREPLPSSRDAEREPPTLVKEIEAEGPITSDEISEYFKLMSEMAMHLPPEAEALWLATTEDFTYREKRRSAREKKDSDYQSEFEEERKAEHAEERLKELVPLWGQMKFNMDFYELADYASEAKLQELDAIGERIEQMTADVEPKWSSPYDDPESEDYQIWQDYETLLPNHILQDDYAVDQARAVLTQMSVFTDPAVSLDPYYDGESRMSYINMNLGMGDHESLKTLHPEAKRAVGEAWRERAMTEGTPENATAVRYGGPKPKMWIETMAAELTEKQWMPTDHFGGEYEIADLLNAGWQQSTSTPGGQLAMESAARVFGESLGAEAPPRNRNEVIASGEKIAEEEKAKAEGKDFTTDFSAVGMGAFKLGHEKYVDMTAEDIHALLDNPETQETADKVLQGMYDDTQQWYADRGFSPDDRVPLYRGMGHIDSEWNPSGGESFEGGDADVDMYSLSSWTAHVPETKAFTGQFMGAVVKAYVPVKNILANPQTGFPCKEEREIVVIGGPDIRGTVYDGGTDYEAMAHGLSPAYDNEFGTMNTGNTRRIIKDYLETAAWYETPDYTALVERQDVPQAAEATRVIEVDLEDADWIAEKLAAAKLTKNMVDGLSDIGPDGEEVEEEEIERRRKIYEGQKRAMEVRNERAIDEQTRLPVEMTPQGGAIFKMPVEEPTEFEIERHYGPGPHPGTGTSQDVHGSGGQAAASYGERLPKSKRERVSWSLNYDRTSDRVTNWFMEAMEDSDKDSSGLNYIYISHFRPLDFTSKLPEGSVISGRVAYTKDPLPMEKILSLELGVFSTEARGALAKDWYEAEYDTGGVYVFIGERRADGEPWGVVVSPSTYSESIGKYQATTFDRRGFSGHIVEATVEKALGESLNTVAKGWSPNPDLFERLVATDEFNEGNKRSMLMNRSWDHPYHRLAERIMFVMRGGKGSGFFEHVGREGELGGSAPEGSRAPVSNRPGVEAYGSAVFTPLLHDIVIGWSDQPGYQVAALIENNVRQAQERGDDDYHGLAIGQDGILMGIGALDYSAEFPEGYGEGLKPEDYLKIDGLYTVEAGFSEELMVQMAMEANRNGKGVWMEMGEEAGVLAAQMGMDVSDDGKYAHWTPEQAAEVAEKLQGLEQVDYVSPPTKPRITVAFDDVWEEEVASNPTPDDRDAPLAVDEMPLDERYRWENFNYSRWATADRWDPQAFGKEQLGYEPTEEGEEEEFISSVYDSRVLEDLQSIHDGWIEGTHSPWSVRLSEAVADRFGGEPVPQARTREQFERPIDYLDALGSEYGSDVVVGDIEMSEFRELPENEQWARLDEFSDFASGARQVDIATDLVSAVDAIYEKTQAEFKAAGYQDGDTVRLYRGLKANPEERLDGHDGGWADVQQWSVSSWTAGKAVASGFATASGGESAGGQGTLLTADVPIEKILANWQTGPGSHDELEYLVISSEPIEAYATKITETANIEVVAEDARMDADGVYEFGTEIE